MKSGFITFRCALLATLAGAIAITPILSQAQNSPPAPTPNYNVPPNDRPTAYGLTYGRPFIDVDEWRDTPRRHRYVHGGFDNSHLRFSIYMPPKELYKKRFLLMLEGGTGGSDKMMTIPGGGGEHESWDFAFNVAFDHLGAYLVETNEGHFPDEGLGTDTPEVLWGASGYGTSYVRNIAAQMYGERPAYGYVQGCSGGGTRSSRHVENLPDLINGSVSEAWGHLGLEQWSVYGLASRLLGAKMEGVKDALDTGGDGNPFKGLDSQQAEALRDMLDMGMIRDAVFQYKSTGWFTTPVQMYHILDTDPTYYQDFWAKPGYEGHDNPAMLKKLLVDEDVEVTKFPAPAQGRGSTSSVAAFGPDGTAKKRTAVLKFNGPPDKMTHATITILSGPDKGKQMYVNSVGSAGYGGGGGAEPYLVSPFTARAPYAFDNVNVGDKVHLSNRDLIAYLYYYRHSGEKTTKLLNLQTPKYRQAFPEFRALMNPDGTSKYVQRTTDPGYKAQTANFKGKIIAVSGEGDEAIWPTSMNAYVRRVHNNLGANVNNQFRMYWINQHSHCGGRLIGPTSTQMPPVEGFTQQALVDLANWVEKGIAPPASNPYTFDVHNAIQISSDAKVKKGMQPVAKLTAPGVKNDRIEVKAGTTVKFTGSAEVPPGAGYIVKGDFDFDGQGSWPENVKNIGGTSPTVSATASYTYSKPGTYFATFRAASHRQGSKMIPGDLPIYDVARVRVVVK